MFEDYGDTYYADKIKSLIAEKYSDKFVFIDLYEDFDPLSYVGIFVIDLMWRISTNKFRSCVKISGDITTRSRIEAKDILLEKLDAQLEGYLEEQS